MDSTILGIFLSNSSKRNHLGGIDDFDEFSPFSLLYAFLDISPRSATIHEKSDAN